MNTALVARRVASNHYRLRRKGEPVGTEPVSVLKRGADKFSVMHYFGNAPQTAQFTTFRAAAEYAISLFNRVAL